MTIQETMQTETQAQYWIIGTQLCVGTEDQAQEWKAATDADRFEEAPKRLHGSTGAMNLQEALDNLQADLDCRNETQADTQKTNNWESRIQVPRNCKIWKAAAKQAGRYGMDCVRFEPPTTGHPACLVATDGRKMAVVPVGGELSSQALAESIPLAVVKEATKGTGSRPSHGTIAVDHATKQAIGGLPGKSMVAGTYGDAEFPARWRQAAEGARNDDTLGMVKLRLNAKYLFELAQAIGAEDDEVTLTLDPEQLRSGKAMEVHKPIHVSPHAGPTDAGDAYGVLMPVSIKKG